MASVIRASPLGLPVPVEPIECAASGVVVMGQRPGPEAALGAAGGGVHPGPVRRDSSATGSNVPSTDR
jgi:hypothetical protein